MHPYDSCAQYAQHTCMHTPKPAALCFCVALLRFRRIAGVRNPKFQALSSAVSGYTSSVTSADR